MYKRIFIALVMVLFSLAPASARQMSETEVMQSFRDSLSQNVIKVLTNAEVAEIDIKYQVGQIEQLAVNMPLPVLRKTNDLLAEFVDVSNGAHSKNDAIELKRVARMVEKTIALLLETSV